MFLEEALAGILALYLDPYPVAFGGNAGSTNNFVPGPGILPTSAQDVNGLGCFLYNALYADFFSASNECWSGALRPLLTIGHRRVPEYSLHP